VTLLFDEESLGDAPLFDAMSFHLTSFHTPANRSARTDMNANNLTPVGPGNQLALRHDAYSRLRLTDAAGETADVVRDLVPIGRLVPVSNVRDV
jgi:hypothetical protein